MRGLGERAQRADDRAAFEIGDERDERDRDEEPEQEPVPGARVGGVDQRLRAQHREADGRSVGDGRRDEHAIAGVADPGRPRLSDTARERAGDRRRRRHDPRVVQDHECIGGRESGARSQDVDERGVERHCDRDRADEPFARHDCDLPRRRETRRATDRETVDSGDRDVRLVAQQMDERGQVAPPELSLEDGRAGERVRLLLGRVEALLVGGEHRS